MSLATRCPACGTIFRVVQDQLKVSEGWVRCGRCEEVFNAVESLFDLETEAPPPWAPPSGRAASGATHALAEVFDAPAPPPALSSPARSGADPAGVALAPLLDVGEGDAAPSTQPATEPMAGATEAAGHDSADVDAPHDASGSPPAGAHLDPVLEATPADTPAFVREAERALRWRQPRVRAALGLAGLLLVSLLAAQAGIAWRSRLAALAPQARPVLLAACELAGCTLEPWRHLEALALEQSSMVKVEGSRTHRLTLAIRNRAEVAIRAPAIELSLTDSQGRLLVRRVLSTGELGARAGDSIPAGAEWPLQALLDVGDLRVAGYTVELFYP